LLSAVEQEAMSADSPTHETTRSAGRSRGERSALWYAAGAFALTVAGIVASILLSVPAFFVGIDTLVGFTLSIVLGEAGYALVAVAFVVLTGRGLSSFGLDLPPSWGLVALVTVGVFVFRTVVVVGAVVAGVEPSPPSITGVDLPVETMLAVLVPASLLVIGPAEELLFRGTVQPYLRERFSPTAAIVGAGVLFAAIHVFALIVASLASAAVSLGVILVVGLAMGWLYERTGSVLAPMVAHGGYNALIFGSAYFLTRLV
jgi:hypothetical protein